LRETADNRLGVIWLQQTAECGQCVDVRPNWNERPDMVDEAEVKSQPFNQHREPARLASDRPINNSFERGAVRFEFAKQVELRASSFTTISTPRKLKRE
jgi:hypothetical protein